MAGPKFSTLGRCRFSVWKRRGKLQFSTPEKCRRRANDVPLRGNGGGQTILNALRFLRVAAPSIRFVPWAALASCWPLPQQLLPVSATGGGRRRCWASLAERIFYNLQSGKICGFSRSAFSRMGPLAVRYSFQLKRKACGRARGSLPEGAGKTVRF